MTHCIYQFEIACTAAERSTTNIRRSCDTKIRRFRCSIGGCRLIKPILSMVCSKKKTFNYYSAAEQTRRTHNAHFTLFSNSPTSLEYDPCRDFKKDTHSHYNRVAFGKQKLINNVPGWRDVVRTVPIQMCPGLCWKNMRT